MMGPVRCWILVVLLIFCCGKVLGQRASLLETPYTPSFTKGEVEDFLQDIRQKTGVVVAYSSSTVARQRTATITGAERTVGAVLQKIFEDEGAQLLERRTKILVVAVAARERAVPTHTVSGVVRDSSSREMLIGAAVQAPALRRGINTNFYGFYSLSLPEGRHTIITSYPGSRADTQVVDLRADVQRNVLLSSQTALEEVKVTESKRAPGDRMRISPLDISRKAAPLGEADLFRALQRTAGVQSETDGSASLLVRGGDPGQNLHLLDGVPLYYVNHFKGITSVFNTDALKNVDFYKGAFPARYGGRVSSVVDVAARDGNMERWTGSASLGLLKGSVVVEGPIVKERASVIVAARRMWYDVLIRPFTDDLRLNFSDINAKANYVLNKKHRLYLSGYTGRDKASADFDSGEQPFFSLREGSNTASLKWTAVWSPKIFLTTTLTYSTFLHQLAANLSDASLDSATTPLTYRGRSTMTDGGITTQLHWYPSAKHRVEAGARVGDLRFAPIIVEYSDEAGSTVGSDEAPRFRATEVTWHVEDAITLSPKWMLRPGLHWATWIGQDFRYTSPQLRMYAAFTPGKHHTIFASVAQMTQYLHSISTGDRAGAGGLVISPPYLWVPSTARLLPEESLIATLGWNGRAGKHHGWSVEGYYKNMKGLLDYRDASTQFYASGTWEDALVAGTGRSYGAEATVLERVGPLQASAAYTLSWTWRKFPGINGGKEFPFRYDRRHTIKTDLLYQPTKRFNLAVAWTYLSGEAFSLPDEMYPDFDNNLPVGGGSPTLALQYSARNNHRLPPIHRLDFAVNFIKPLRRGRERTWTLGLFNAYARRNPVAPVLTIDDGVYKLQNTLSFRLLPTISYHRTF